MGQRLVVDLIQNNKTIAVVYYHWSAYFIDTILELGDLSTDIIEAKNENKDILEAVLDGLEKRGGGVGVNPINLKEASKRFPGRTFKTDISRNKGLLYLGESEIQATINMAEGTAGVDLDTLTMYNDVDLNGLFEVTFGRNYFFFEGERVDMDPWDMTCAEAIQLSQVLKDLSQKAIKRKEKEVLTW